MKATIFVGALYFVRWGIPIILSGIGMCIAFVGCVLHLLLGFLVWQKLKR